MVLQEWASHNGVPVPHKEGRVNNSLLYKGGEEDTPTNILQVGISLPPALWTCWIELYTAPAPSAALTRFAKAFSQSYVSLLITQEPTCQTF